MSQTYKTLLMGESWDRGRGMLTDREHIDSESEQIQEVFAHFGLAMLQAQALERQLAVILVTKNGPGLNSITGTERDKILEGLFSKTLGTLVSKVGTAPQLNEDDKEKLSQALDKRNWLVHEYFWDRAKDILSESGRASMIEELKEDAEYFQTVDELFTSRSVEWFEEAGITKREIDQAIEQAERDASR